MKAEEAANLVEKVNGCALWLDWTGNHQRDSCTEKTKGGKPYSSCKMYNNGKECGLKHHELLHGSTVKFCSLTLVHHYIRSRPSGERVDVDEIPTDEDLECSDAKAGQNMLMQMQNAYYQGTRKCIGVTFFDCGSNITLVRAEFVRKLGLIGKPCIQWVQVSKREPEAWETTAYWLKIVECDGQEHKILAFEVENITASLGYVDVSELVNLFTGLSTGLLVLWMY